MKTKVEIEMEITPEIIDAIAEKLISSGDYFPVVRCKDCQHLGEYLTEEKTYPNWCMINQHFILEPDNWFCANGVKYDA